jgi:hypothetical protein
MYFVYFLIYQNLELLKKNITLKLHHQIFRKIANFAGLKKPVILYFCLGLTRLVIGLYPCLGLTRVVIGLFVFSDIPVWALQDL